MNHVARGALVVILLLTFVGTASAECAWVLWGEVNQASGDAAVTVITHWTLHKAFKSDEQCWSGAANAAAAYGASIQGTVGDSLRGPTVFGQRDGRTISTTYLCLPDTVDPRGPKAR